MSAMRATFAKVSANLRRGPTPPSIHDLMSFIRRAFQTMHPAAQVVLLSCIVLTFMALAAGVGVVWV